MLLCCGALAQELTHTSESLADVKQALEEGRAVLVDVRDKVEWKAGHLKDAILLPLPELQQMESSSINLPQDKPIYVHCASGRRALIVAKKLRELGFDARPLKAGFVELREKGFEQAPKEE